VGVTINNGGKKKKEKYVDAITTTKNKEFEVYPAKIWGKGKKK
jgi:hypothetical protein